MVDPILIEQVLVNLLKNAAESIDHAERPAGRRSVELRVGPRQVDEQRVIEFTVLDSGVNAGHPDLAGKVVAEAVAGANTDTLGHGGRQ